jgi:hypothetical protein
VLFQFNICRLTFFRRLFVASLRNVVADRRRRRRHSFSTFQRRLAKTSSFSATLVSDFSVVGVVLVVVVVVLVFLVVEKENSNLVHRPQVFLCRPSDLDSEKDRNKMCFFCFFGSLVLVS